MLDWVLKVQTVFCWNMYRDILTLWIYVPKCTGVTIIKNALSYLYTVKPTTYVLASVSYPTCMVHAMKNTPILCIFLYLGSIYHVWVLNSEFWTLHNFWRVLMTMYKVSVCTRSRGGGAIAQSVASLFATGSVQVCARYDPLVSERLNSISVLLTCSHQCWQLVKKGSPCVIMSV